ncbi:hypothetical protein [Streptomyces asiaticus]|uniref:hypothetical protein n=1 Tax=Streptomyces asiaticus TaxID=114695 RepID=UPI003D73436D
MSPMSGATEPAGTLEIHHVRYQSGILTASWDAGQRTPATTFHLYVFDGTAIVRETDVGQSVTVSLPIDLAARPHAEVAVRSFIGTTPHQWSSRAPVLTDTVELSRADTDPVTGAVTLTWAGDENDVFLARMSVNGASADPDIRVTGGSSTVPAPLPGAMATAALARVRTSGTTMSVGPLGFGLALPTQRPELLVAAFDAGELSLTWSDVPGADAYRVSVLHDGRVFFTTEVPAPTTTVGVDPGITDRFTYSAVVQAVTAAGSGPPSSPAPLAFDGPVIGAVRSDGSTVTIDVTPPTGVTVTGYDVVLYRDGVAVYSATLGPVSPLSFPGPATLPPGAAYTVSVRARSGIPIGPATTAPAVLALPAVVSVDALGGELIVTVAPGDLAPGVAAEAVLFVDGVQGAPQRVGADGTAGFPLPSSRAVDVTVRGVEGVATGPWSPRVSAPTARPEVIAARVEDGRLVLVWNGPQPDATFRATVGTTEVVIRGETATLPLDAARRLPETATVAQVAGVATGPVTSVPVVTTGPRLVSVTMDAARAATMMWISIQPPTLTGIQPVVRWPGNEVELDVQPPYVEPIVLTLPDDIPNTATVALRGLAGAATGPPGNAVSLLTAAPTGVTVDYDGSELRVSWDPFPIPLISGYRVSTVGEGTVTTVADTTATRGSWRQTITDPSAAVIVQALAGPAVGAPTAPVPVFTESLFVGPSSIAPQTGPAPRPQDIVLGFPELFSVPPSAPVSLPLDMTLTPTGTPPYTYVLEVPRSSAVWTFTDRPDVIGEWKAVLARLEPLTITPYGIAALTEAVSRALPQTFAETLYFAYGLEFDRGCFDLRPGIVVRVEYESYQAVPGSQSQPLSGFVTGAAIDYEVASYDRSGVWSNGPDAFLSALTRQGVIVPDPSAPPPAGQQFGGGGVLDLFTRRMQLPFARVVYPPTVLDTASPGSAFPQQNAVVLAGRTLSALEAATENVRHSNPPGAGVASAYLRGRTVIRALIRISVSGAPRLVPLGTTLGNVLAGEGLRPPAVRVAPRGVTLHRARGAAMRPDGPSGDWRVITGWADYDPAVLDLPMLHGDRLGVTAVDER